MGLYNRSLKILHILEHGITLSSGYGFRSVNIFRAQLDRGWQPVVLTFPKPDQSGKSEWKQPETVGEIKCYYRPLPASRRHFSFLTKPSRARAFAKRIREVVEIEKPDVLHAHSPVFNGVAALKVGQQLGIPVVYEIRSLWEEAAVAHGTYGSHSYQFKRTRFLETRLCQSVDQVVTISEGLKNHLVGRGIEADKILTVYNGVDLDTMMPREPDAQFRETWNLTGEKRIVGYIGSFRRYEGLDLLVKAIAHLRKARSNIILLLIGGGRLEAESEVRILVDRLGLREKVIMPGWLPPERIPGVYALVDVLAYPRHQTPLTEIVTPLKPLEAMAMGKALIASDIGGHRELIQTGHNGLLFTPGNEFALADAVCRLLDDHGLRQKLAAQATAWVRRERSWSKTTSVYAEVYDKAQKANASAAALHLAR